MPPALPALPPFPLPADLLARLMSLAAPIMLFLSGIPGLPAIPGIDAGNSGLVPGVVAPAPAVGQ
ncbi:hypothetical protein [Corynebacterium senegalense]|uniref:hypothetical protein n=1 Tax=Corynebacterium senegalense TaxID=2080750 RepID=UPI000E20A4CD|nr:hypothetical protein [Corynebacterium senegalense]